MCMIGSTAETPFPLKRYCFMWFSTTYPQVARYDIEISGHDVIQINGHYNIQISGHYNMEVNGHYNIRISGHYNIQGAGIACW